MQPKRAGRFRSSRRFRVQEFRASCLGFGVQGLRFRTWVFTGLGLRVSGNEGIKCYNN